MSEESLLLERAQSAEVKFTTAQAGNERLKEKIRFIKETFGAKEKSDGSFDIDYQKFVNMLGMEKALEVRAIIDETYRIKGDAGEKPKITMPLDNVTPVHVPVIGPASDFPPEPPAGDLTANPPPITKDDADPVMELLTNLSERLAYMEERMGV